MTALDHAREILPLWVVWGPVVAWLGASLLLGLLPGALYLRFAMRPPDPPSEMHWTELARRAWSARMRGMSIIIEVTIVFGCYAYLFVSKVAGISPAWMIGVTSGVLFAGLMWMDRRQLRAWRVEDTPRWTRRRRIGGALTTGIGLLPHLWLLVVGAVVLPPAPTPAGIALLVVFGLLFVGSAAGGGVDVLLLVGVAHRVDLDADTKVARAVRSAVERTGVSPSSVLEVPSARVNAFAILLQRRVIVTDGLVEALSEGEIAAIVGHELGHLAEPRSVGVLRSLVVFSPFLILVAKVLVAPFGFVPLGVALLVVLVAMWVLGRHARRLEERADHVAHTHEDEPGSYAHALETIYRLNVMPAVMPGKRRAHPHLYDRLLAAGVEPDYPRPDPPARKSLLPRWASNLVFFAVIIGLSTGHVLLSDTWLAQDGTEPRALLRLTFTQDLGPDLAFVAALRRRAGRFDDAAVLYGAAAEMVPTFAGYRMDQASALADEGRCERAREVASRIPVGHGVSRALRAAFSTRLRYCRSGSTVTARPTDRSQPPPR